MRAGGASARHRQPDLQHRDTAKSPAGKILGGVCFSMGPSEPKLPSDSLFSRLATTCRIGACVANDPLANPPRASVHSVARFGTPTL